MHDMPVSSMCTVEELQNLGNFVPHTPYFLNFALNLYISDTVHGGGSCAVDSVLFCSVLSVVWSQRELRCWLVALLF